MSISKEGLAGLSETDAGIAVLMLTEFKEEVFVNIEANKKIIVNDKNPLEYYAQLG